MTAVKSYTDIKQSHELAEILPIESADGYYSWHDERYYIVNKDCPYPYSLKEKIPCWSLTALLQIIPKNIEGLNRLRIDIDNMDFSIWYDNLKGYGVTDKLPDITSKEPVDACYEMILKLNKLNLL